MNHNIADENSKLEEMQSVLDALDKSQAVIEFNIDGTIISANSLFLDVMGYQLEEIQGKHHSIFVEPSYKHDPEYIQFWESLSQGKHQTAEFKRLGKNSKIVWIHASYNPILDENGKAYKVIKFATDVTQQKLIDANYKGQIEAISKSQAVIEFNMDGTIISANDNFLSAMGYTLDEVKGQHHSMFVEPGYKQSAEYAQFWQNLNQGAFQTAEYKRLGKNGREVWIQATYNPIFDLNGKPFKVVKYATNVTAQKLQAADFSGQIEAISKSQAVIEFNMDGTIISANDNFLSAMGYTLDEVKGQHHSMFVEPDYKNSLEYKQFWDKLNQGEFQAAEYKRLGKNGKEIWIQATYNPIFDLNQRPVKVVKYATDITFRKTTINTIKDLFLSVSEGDLSRKLENEFEGDFKILGDSINSLIDNLVKVISEIHISSSSVKNTAIEISEGNIDLSRRTDQQAVALEETTATMEEMTTFVKKNSINAQQAAQFAANARAQAESGGYIISNLINSMAEINSSSKNIADIISTIDEIAFQTNLLALNAAVEAARAGDQGKGFAVVATEVRNLAQRSASAAKEIKQLINDSVEKAHEGSKLADQSGETLSDIIEAVIKVNNLMSDIAEAAHSQSTGIEQINHTVIQLDESTQQNAALVEEATATAKEMEEQAIKLDNIMGQFTIDFYDGGSTRIHQLTHDEPIYDQQPRPNRRRRRLRQRAHSAQ